jgi:hypothetical protein
MKLVGPIPEEIERLLAGNIESFDQLEVLRVLGNNPGKEWGVAELAKEVQAERQALTSHLATLHARGLLTCETRGGECLYRHGPHTLELEDLVRRLLQLYRERPVTVIRLVYARADAGLRAFAEAFRIRKEG